MKQKLLFTGQEIDLDKSIDEVKEALNGALWRFYPKEAVCVCEYEEHDDNTPYP